VDNFLVIRSALGNPGGSPVKCISISVIAIDQEDTKVKQNLWLDLTAI